MSQSLLVAFLSLACLPLLSTPVFAEAQTAPFLGAASVIFTAIRYLGWSLAGLGIVYMLVAGIFEISGRRFYEGLRDIGFAVLVGVLIFTVVMPQVDGFMAAASTGY
jgi:hypothetical protein